jgi:PAS domain S-box-containing protein
MNVTIKKRIQWSFALLVTIFFLNGIATIYTLQYSKKLSRHISEVADPSLRSLYDLRKSLLQSRMFITNWVFLRYDQDSKQQLMTLRNSSFPEQKMNLLALSQNWRSQTMRDSLKILLNGVSDILLSENKVINSLQHFGDYDDLVKKMGAEEQLENIIIPKSLAQMELLKTILTDEQVIRTEEQNNFEWASALLQKFIVILIITITAAGVFLAVYLSNIILKPVNRIREIVNDLGLGVIRKLDDQDRHDEMGQMIQSVNNLSEKFSAMGKFALMVGKREFGAQYEPLSENDTLGKALLAMRDGLRDSERELLRTHFQLDTLFKKIDEVFFSMDMVEYKMLQMSPACEAVYGYHATDFFKNPMIWYEVTIEEDRHILEAKDAVMKSGKPIQHETRIRHKDNSIHWVETKITPTLDAEGRLTRIDGVVSDITERKEAEELLRKRNTELMKSNMELDKFVYSVSHDLRAPLLSMLGMINIAKEDTQDDLMSDHLALMESCIKRLDGFIKDILDYSRNSKNEIRKEEINFKELFSHVTRNLKYINGSRKIEIKIDADEAKLFVCDKDRISTVLNNLISNAVWYQNPAVDHPLVNVKIDMSDTETNIIVQDNGIGISKENQPRIFEMFYRVSQNSVGSGLGLYIVKEIVEKLNGKIEVESEIGKGTTFHIQLPNSKQNYITARA